jgi:hypothetical protein
VVPDEYEQAAKRAADRRGFWIRVGAWAVVNVGVVIWSIAGTAHYEALFVTGVIWGVGLSFRGVRVFSADAQALSRDRRTRQELESRREHDGA